MTLTLVRSKFRSKFHLSKGYPLIYLLGGGAEKTGGLSFTSSPNPSMVWVFIPADFAISCSFLIPCVGLPWGLLVPRVFMGLLQG
jgi:hypothetical protein